MPNRLYPWLRLLFGGALLFATSASSCVSDMIRDASDNLDELANDINDENDINDFDEWLDQVF